MREKNRYLPLSVLSIALLSTYATIVIIFFVAWVGLVHAAPISTIVIVPGSSTSTSTTTSSSSSSSSTSNTSTSVSTTSTTTSSDSTSTNDTSSESTSSSLSSTSETNTSTTETSSSSQSTSENSSGPGTGSSSSLTTSRDTANDIPDGETSAESGSIGGLFGQLAGSRYFIPFLICSGVLSFGALVLLFLLLGRIGREKKQEEAF